MFIRSAVLVARVAGGMGSSSAVRFCLALSLGACEPMSRQVAPDAGGPTDAPVVGEGVADANVAISYPDAGSTVTELFPPAVMRDAGPPRVFDPSASPPAYLHFPDPVATLPHGDPQRAALCARAGQDLVTDAFCAEPAPRIGSFAELLALLKVDPTAYSGSSGFAITGHSTSLSKRSASAINPRVIFLHTEYSATPLLAVAFTRGEPVVEIVTRDRATKELQFFLLSFTLPCNDGGGTCTPGALLTPAIEQNWQRVDLYGEEDLKNTPVDCRTCHQPSGPSTAKMLRMQELNSPWTHWFDDQSRGGRALMDDYYAAHGQGEALAGIPGTLVVNARATALSAFVSIGGSKMQPYEFLSDLIESDVERAAPNQPADNQTRGTSDTWKRLFQAAQHGDAIPVPYHDVKVTDPSKLSGMQQAYTQYLKGTLPQSALPDIRDVFPDDPAVLADMGFMVDERLDDSALFVAACGLCHNARLDQNLSRARFHTDLARLSADEKKTAIERLSLPGSDPMAMPPRRIHDLSDKVRDRLIALLRR